MTHKFPYKWNLADGYPAKGIEPNGLKVFSCFACGGGSTMGYKLAGYEVLGCNEIDPEMIGAYKANHNPKFAFLGPIQEFKKRESFPDELMNLDILDGSPPCSSFSMSGSREKKWGVKKKFREGQAEQVLDDLFFDFLDLAERLQPKVIVAENVKGMLLGNARSYVKKISRRFKEIGYEVQLFLLNAATMGVPQKRERVFFIANRMGWGKLELKFEEEAIPFLDFEDVNDIDEIKDRTTRTFKGWINSKQGESFRDAIGDHGSMFGYNKVKRNAPIRTIVSSNGTAEFHYKLFRKLNNIELCCGGSYPQDYKFPKAGAKYLIGMSVPPVMTAQIAHEIWRQWFLANG